MKKDAQHFPIAININFDSLACALGFPEGFRDPSYFGVLDRFLEGMREVGAKGTFLVIGRDLENPEVAARVRDLSDEGHEIGNHTWSHPLDFGALPKEEIESEILRTHEIVQKTTGREPRGFVAPVWSASGDVYRVLVDNGYRYDTSAFPSVFLYPMLLRFALRLRKDRELARKVLRRRDWTAPLIGPKEPFFVDREGRAAAASGGEGRILVMPMPAKNRFSPPLWHTMGSVFGWDFLKRRLSVMLESKTCFYYLMHPADLIGREEMEGRSCPYLLRMEAGVEEKTRRFREVLEVLAASGRGFATVGELAEQYRAARDIAIPDEM